MIVLAGLGGPLLALTPRLFVPLAIGELAAGALVGRTGFGAVHPSDPTTAFLASVGFAMLMLTVGMHLPLRERRLFASLRRGAMLAAIVGVLAVPAGIAGGGARRHRARGDLRGRARVGLGGRAAAGVRGGARGRRATCSP